MRSTVHLTHEAQALLLATRIRPRGRAELSGPQAAPLRPAPSQQGPPRPQAWPRFSQWSLQHLSAISVVGSNVGETERVALGSSTSGNQKRVRRLAGTLSNRDSFPRTTSCDGEHSGQPAPSDCGWRPGLRGLSQRLRLIPEICSPQDPYEKNSPCLLQLLLH